MTRFTFIPHFVDYYMNLQLPRTIKNIQYRYRSTPIVYAIRCQVTNRVYVGSSFTPGRRIHNHLVTGHYSNAALQAAIAKYGLSKFTYYTLEVVEMPSGLSSAESKAFLLAREQDYINRFPKSQLYNAISSSVSHASDNQSL